MRDAPYKYQEQVSKTSIKNKEKKVNFAENVFLTEKEHQTLKEKYGEDFTNKCIEKLDNYKGSSGKKYVSDYRAILSWVVDEVMEVKIKKEPKSWGAIRRVAKKYEEEGLQ